jgi:hypothetical protein
MQSCRAFWHPWYDKEADMSELSLDDRISHLLTAVDSCLERRHGNLRSSIRPLLDASAQLTRNHDVMASVAYGDALPREEALTCIGDGLAALRGWIAAAVGGQAPDGMDRVLTKWEAGLSGLRAEVDMERAPAPAM